MIDEGREGRKANAALPYFFMAVLLAGKRIFAVVQVDGPQTVKAHGPLKGIQHAVQIVYQIISAVVDVAGVQTHAQKLRVLHAVNNGPQFLKSAAHLAALARHRLKKYRGGLSGPQNRVQRLRNQSNAHVEPLLDMAAGMEVIETAGEVLQPRKIVRHGI